MRSSVNNHRVCDTPHGVPLRHDRMGSATVEMAICMPLLMLIGFAATETANVVFLKQSLAQIAYEGARTGLQPNAALADVVQQCNDLLTARNISGATVSVTPSNLSGATPAGTAIAVTVSASANANAISPTWFFKTSVITKKVVMTRL